MTNYEVNPLGQRQRKTNSLGDTVFLYDTHGRLIAEFTSIGLLKREYIYLGEIPVAVILGNGQNFGPTADSYVDQNQPSANKGGESKLKVDPQKLRSYFKFDLAGIAGVITTAKLRLWGKSGAGQGSPVAAYSVADTNWGEMTITWANQPTAGATALSTTHVGSTQAWYEWDLTTYVSAEYAAGRPVVSFMLFGIPPGDDEEFNSRQNLNNKPFLYVEPGTALYYIHVDHLNTPRLISNPQGQTVWRWDQQEPFGVTVPDENPSGLGAFEFPLRFPGQYFDKETNLHYNYFRDYDPSLGRYVESDPIGLLGGLNTYAYVDGRPLLSIDPRGDQSKLPFVNTLQDLLIDFFVDKTAGNVPQPGTYGGKIGKLICDNTKGQIPSSYQTCMSGVGITEGCSIFKTAGLEAIQNCVDACRNAIKQCNPICPP